MTGVYLPGELEEARGVVAHCQAQPLWVVILQDVECDWVLVLMCT